jgi:hypothetical protein
MVLGSRLWPFQPTYVNESIKGLTAHNGVVFVDGSGINAIEATVW